MLLFGGAALRLRGEPLNRPSNDFDFYGSMGELAELETRLRQQQPHPVHRRQTSSEQRFRLKFYGCGPIEFDCLTPELLAMTEGLPDNEEGIFMGMRTNVASSLTVHLIKQAYVDMMPARMMHPKHGHDIEQLGGRSDLVRKIRSSPAHFEFFSGLRSEIQNRLQRASATTP